MPVRLVHTVQDLRRQVAAWRSHGERIALVPTMGALHAGHVSLMTAARQQADRVILTIFVNPTQFAPTEDLSRYPRTLDADLARAEGAGADLAFVPEVAEMYPAEFATTVALAGPALGLETDFRPTHFAGVATVVAKLFNQAAPDIALFGEKDYQQLKVISRMARDLDLTVRVIGVPTLRESDGLALSSRNVYLSPAEREIAPALYRALNRAAVRIAGETPIDIAVEDARGEVAAASFLIDYVEARHAETLAPIHSIAEGPVRLLAAARLGATRLIDNVAVPHGVT